LSEAKKSQSQVQYMKNSFFTFFFTLFHAIIAHSQAYQAGITYLGTQNYIEFRAGNLPIIITAPHNLQGQLIIEKTINAATDQAVLDVLHPLSMGTYILTFREEKGGFIKQIKVLFE
jgi:lauroyl/myristoyl acyltransferase